MQLKDKDKKLYKVGKRYYSNKKGIYGLEIYTPLMKEWGGKYEKYTVKEDISPEHNFWDRKTVFTGTLKECRNYIKNRFNKNNHP